MSYAVETFEYFVECANWDTLVSALVLFVEENGDFRLRGKNNIGTTNSINSYSQILFGNITPLACIDDIRTLIDFDIIILHI